MPQIAQDFNCDLHLNLNQLQRISISDDNDKNKFKINETPPSKVASYSDVSTSDLSSPKSPFNVTDYIDLDTLEEIWNGRRKSFIKQIFPQFFIKVLDKFQILNSVDLAEYQEMLSINDDFEDPQYRIRVYESLNQWLFNCLLGKLRIDFRYIYKIIDALRYNGWYPLLADELQSHLNDKKLQINNKLLKFKSSKTKTASKLVNFPEPISYCINRSSKSDEILEHLLRIEKNGWLIVYGLKGSGKTILVENSIRNFTNLPFDDGIYWLNIGQLSEDMFEQELRSKIEILHESVNFFHKKTIPKHDQLDNLLFNLKYHFKECPKSLIILDDVQSKEIFKFFQFEIPVLVTTPDKGVVPMELNRVKYVSTQIDNNGNILDMEESMALMKKCLPKIADEYLARSVYLPNIIRSINGIPYFLPLLANYMAPFIENHSYFNELYFANLEALWEQLSIAIPSNIIDCAELLLDKSFKNINPTLVDFFYDFAIFPEQVSFAVLDKLWGNDSIKTAQNLTQFYQKSLVQFHPMVGLNRTLKGITNKMFNVHDITITYLKNKLGKEEFKKRHEKLLNAYLKYCYDSSEANGCQENLVYNFSNMPKEKYIYRCISYHIYYSERLELFPKIFLDMKFLQNKIRMVGQSHILSDFYQYKKYFNSKIDLEKLDALIKFIASNTYTCYPDVDLFQVALCEPNNSFVYNEAKRIIDIDRNRFYFNWCNKENFINQYKKICLRFNDRTKWAALSPDSKLIVSVNDLQVNAWDSCTGQLLSEQIYHAKDVNYCSFSIDGKFVLTTGDDGKAILWKNTFNYASYRIEDYYSRRRIPLQTLTPCQTFSYCNLKLKADSATNINSVELKCGDISPNNRFILLANSNGYIYIFSIELSKIVYSSINPDELNNEISCCSFSLDSRYFLFTLTTRIYVYSFVPDFNNQNVKVSIRFKLESDKVAHNAVFGSIPRSDKISIFSANERFIYQWDLVFDFMLTINKSSQTVDQPTRKYTLPGDGSGYISLCAVSKDAKLIAGFETTRNEIYLWNRNVTKSHLCFYTFSTILTLSFNEKEKSLFALNSKNEITLWDLKECNAVISVVDLKDNFSATFKKNGSELNVLTIDNKGFLRLYMDRLGIEDKKFKDILKEKLSTKTTKLQPKMNIISCDISPKGLSIFGTDDGQVFFYDHANSKLISYRHENNQEEIFNCEFAPEHELSEDDITFITMSQNEICFYRVSLELKEIIHYFTFKSSRYEYQAQHESFYFVSPFKLIACSNAGECAFLDFIDPTTLDNNSGYFKLSSKITCVHSFRYSLIGHFIIIAFVESFLFLFRWENGNSISIIKRNSLPKNELPRCCQICSQYIVYGTDNGNICQIPCEQFYSDEEYMTNSSTNCSWIVNHTHLNWILQLAISPDERFIISAADSIKLWRNDGILLQTFITHGNVSRFFVHFDENNDDMEPNLKLKLVTLADKKSLYILENYY